MIARVATIADKPQLRKMSKTDPLIDPFNRPEYSNPSCYARGTIRVIVDELGTIAGFTCFNHKKREPVTVLYFLMVDPTFRRHGVGRLLMLDLIKNSPSMIIRLNCCKTNVGAIAFYRSLGFDIIGESLNNNAFLMEKGIKPNVKSFL